MHNHKALKALILDAQYEKRSGVKMHDYFYIIKKKLFIFQVSWVRYRDTSLLSVGKFVYISDRRFKVLHEVNSSDWFLVIKSVTYDDQGIYECQVNSDPYRTFKFHLSVVGEYFSILPVFLFLVHISEKKRFLTASAR